MSRCRLRLEAALDDRFRFWVLSVPSETSSAVSEFARLNGGDNSDNSCKEFCCSSVTTVIAVSSPAAVSDSDVAGGVQDCCNFDGEGTGLCTRRLSCDDATESRLSDCRFRFFVESGVAVREEARLLEVTRGIPSVPSGDQPFRGIFSHVAHKQSMLLGPK